MDTSARDVCISGFLGWKKSQESARDVNLHIGIFLEKIKLNKQKRKKMINRDKLRVLAQIIGVMEDTFVKLEKAYKRKNVEDLEKSKKTILEFQEKLVEEIAK